MNIALIIAGGSGQRMQSEIPKQFINVYDKPVLIYTLEAFQKHPEIDSYFAVEYSLARIVYTCLRKLGLQEKCPVVCFDGSDNIVHESMFTHVKQNEKEIGSLSVRILADEIRGDDEVKTILVPYHIREMTKGAME